MPLVCYNQVRVMHPKEIEREKRNETHTLILANAIYDNHKYHYYYNLRMQRLRH